jgi:hypothetical protein
VDEPQWWMGVQTQMRAGFWRCLALWAVGKSRDNVLNRREDYPPSISVGRCLATMIFILHQWDREFRDSDSSLLYAP